MDWTISSPLTSAIELRIFARRAFDVFQGAKRRRCDPSKFTICVPDRFSEAKATTRAGIHGLTFHDLRGTAVVTLARAGCNEVEIYSITGHKPSDVQAILTTHYLPRDAEVAGNAIAKLKSSIEDKRRTETPTSRLRQKSRKLKRQSPNKINWLGRLDSNQGMAESKSAALPLGYAPSHRRIAGRRRGPIGGAHHSGVIFADQCSRVAGWRRTAVN